MTYDELTEKLGQRPGDLYVDFQGAEKASREKYYLYEIHHMYHDHWESNVWIFDSIEQFKRFLPVLIFSWESVHFEDYDFEERVEEIDYEEGFALYQKALSEKWKSAEDCNRFLKELADAAFVSGDINPIEFGIVADLLSVTVEEFEKCKDWLTTEKELQEAGLAEGRYQIYSEFWRRFEKHPSENEEQFLEMLSDWE
jgi:hypothetical protein